MKKIIFWLGSFPALVAVFAISLVLVAPAYAYPFDASLVTKYDAFPTQDPVRVVARDMNADGQLDLVVANYETNDVTIFWGRQDGAFNRSAAAWKVGIKPVAVATADFNGDGKVDIATANWGEGKYAGSVSVLLAAADTSTLLAESGLFTLVVDPIASGVFSWDGENTTATVKTPLTMIQAGDVNNDGKMDLVFTAFNDSDLVFVALGKGDGAFNDPASYKVGLSPHGLVLVDTHGNGNLDIVTANYGDNSVSTLFGDEQGSFSGLATYSSKLLNTHPIAVAVADLNGDGKLDLAVANDETVERTTSTVSVFLGTGSGAFETTSTNYLVGARPYEVKAVDVNGDKKLDLITPNYGDDSLAVLVNNGNASGVMFGDGEGQNGVAKKYNFGGMLSHPSAVATGDFNKDGRIDVAVANRTGNNVMVILNSSAVAAPTNLTVTNVETSSVALAWTDNSANEINFHVEKSENGVDFMSVTTVAADTTSTQLTNLKPNTRYWFRVTAKGMSDESPRAVSAPVYTLTSVPGNVAATAVSDMAISVAWTGDGTDYLVDNLGKSSATTTSTTVVFTSLTCNTEYIFSITARNGDGVSTPTSALAKATTTACPVAGGGSGGSGGNGGGSGGGGSSGGSSGGGVGIAVGPTNLKFVFVTSTLDFSANTIGLALSADGNPVQMVVGDKKDFPGASWVAYATTSVWNFGAEASGPLTLYAKFRNNQNESATVSATFILNRPGVVSGGGQVLGEKISRVDELIALTRFGERSNNVKELQRELKRLGFYTFKSITGYYGPITKKAVQKYQASQKVLGVKIKSLDELIAACKFGSRGREVTEIQTQLKALGYFPAKQKVTNYYGAITRAAIQKYLAAK